jgi:hypothetical protein
MMKYRRDAAAQAKLELLKVQIAKLKAELNALLQMQRADNQATIDNVNNIDT